MKSKIIMSVLLSLMFSVVSGTLIGGVTGLPIVGVSTVLFSASFIPMKGGVALAGVYREVWTGEVIKVLDSGIKDSFLDGIPDKSRYVIGDDEVQVINSTLFDVEPDVLINNTTYPIPLQELDGTNIPITLDKYQTKVTPITDDELFALAYDEIKEVKDSHGNAIVRHNLGKAIHALAPAGDAANTPVITTTGATSTDGTRKRMRWVDIINLRERYGAAGIDVDGMRIVLCPDHVNDLLLEDKDLFKTLTNWRAGVVNSQLGFEIRSYIAAPYFNATALTKLSFGALPTATDRMASVVFTPSLARKARGLTKMYYSEARTDPQYQRNLVSFRNYFIALPSVNKAIGAIVSAPA